MRIVGTFLRRWSSAKGEAVAPSGEGSFERTVSMWERRKRMKGCTG
jgi:hypothetical protein